MVNYIISFLTFLEVVCALLLIAIILMQRSKSGGGLGAIGGGATEEVFGSNASSILTKSTIYLSIFFFINTLGLAVLQGNAMRNKDVSVVDKLEEVSADNTIGSLKESEPAAPAAIDAETTEGQSKELPTSKNPPSPAKPAPVEGSKTSEP